VVVLVLVWMVLVYGIVRVVVKVDVLTIVVGVAHGWTRVRGNSGSGGAGFQCLPTLNLPIRRRCIRG
jgi:hypothetical protein